MDEFGQKSGEEYYTISLNPFVSSDSTKRNLPPGRVLLSRSTITYRGSKAYKSKRIGTGQRPRPSRACDICLEARDLLWPTALCLHESNVCAPCLQEYVSHAVKAEGRTQVGCPSLGCGEVLSYEEMVEYIGGDKGCLDRLNASIAQSKLERHPKFVWCTNATCGRGQVHTEEDPMVTCNHCHAQSCFVHRVPWHQDLTCEQYTIGANEEYIGTHTKRCPNPVCSLPIEKSYGCDYMMCRCGHQFCWACMADFSIIFQQGTDHHNLNCSHYTPTGATANPPAPPRRNRQAAFRNQSRLVAAAKLLTRRIGRLVSSARDPSYGQI